MVYTKQLRAFQAKVNKHRRPGHGSGNRIIRYIVRHFPFIR